MRYIPSIRLAFPLITISVLHLSPAAAAIEPPSAPPPSVRLLAPNAQIAFHKAISREQVWNDSSFEALLLALKGLSQHGLNPEDYHLQALVIMQDEPQARDILATDAWFSAAAHMIYGKLNPSSVEPDWTASRRKADLSALLASALEEGRIATSLDTLAPRQTEYKRLVDEYARINAENAEPIVQLVDGHMLKPGMTGPRVVALQARLVQLELLAADQASGVMDGPTDIAVRAFQLQAELAEDGLVGASTRAALNRDLQSRLDQLRVNMERWRWLPDDLGRRHLRANIADFNLTAWENGLLVQTHLTIVGKTFRKTPVFSDEVEYIVFNPWWETPASLARTDKLNLFKRDPGAVRRLGFQVLDRFGAQVDPDTIDWKALSASNFPYRLRQAPGDMNALGKVKIIFPNGHNVYIHDTPNRDLFEQRTRAFSSGCMRTQDPLTLAAWLLLETPNWPRTRIDAAVISGAETRVDLSTKVPVHILYITVVSEADGNMRYLDDIYQRDDAVLAGLNTAPGA